MSLTVRSLMGEGTSLMRELQQALVADGFEVVPEQDALNTVKVSQKEIKPVYALNPWYQYLEGNEKKIKDFQVDIIDLYTGESVMNISLKGVRS